MSEEFSKTYEKLQRKFYRQSVQRVWNTAQAGKINDLSEEDHKLALIMLDHEEYHDQFARAEDLVDHEYDPNREVNPFLHIQFHLMIEEQLSSNVPIEAAFFYEAFEDRGYPRHEIIHLMLMILVQLTWEALIDKVPFDKEKYRRLLKRCRKAEPSKIQEILEKEAISH